MPIDPPLPVPTPLAFKLPVTCKLLALTVPAVSVNEEPFPFAPSAPEVIALVVTDKVVPADNINEPPLPAIEVVLPPVMEAAI